LLDGEEEEDVEEKADFSLFSLFSLRSAAESDFGLAENHDELLYMDGLAIDLDLELELKVGTEPSETVRTGVGGPRGVGGALNIGVNGVPGPSSLIPSLSFSFSAIALRARLSTFPLLVSGKSSIA